MSNVYNGLKNRDILDILIGDKLFEKIEDIDVSMPYLSGNDLCSISMTFGLEQKERLSRWQYLNNLIDYCIKEDKIQQLLNYLFAKDRFVNMLTNLESDDVKRLYNEIVNIIVKKISGILYFSDNEFVIVNKQFIIKPLNDVCKIEVPKIKKIDRKYIKELSERAFEDIEKSNYDSALTKSRTLLEEVFCYVIELKNEKPSGNGNIKALYKQVKNLYDMHTAKDIDIRINNLLSGLEKILTSISEMRNADSDAHGVGNKRINIKEHHARLFLNASIMMSDFILSVAENKN